MDRCTGSAVLQQYHSTAASYCCSSSTCGPRGCMRNSCASKPSFCSSCVCSTKPHGNTILPMSRTWPTRRRGYCRPSAQVRSLGKTAWLRRTIERSTRHARYYAYNIEHDMRATMHATMNRCQAFSNCMPTHFPQLPNPTLPRACLQSVLHSTKM